jgi:hypothetical protein
LFIRDRLAGLSERRAAFLPAWSPEVVDLSGPAAPSR